MVSRISLRPSQICFTQDSISDHFTDGTSLTDTFTELVSGKKTVRHLPTITCVEHEGKYWVIHGNRRLFLFKMLENCGIIQTVPVNIKEYNQTKFEDKCTTKNGGQWVFCRNDRNLAKKLWTIANNYRNEHLSDAPNQDNEIVFDFWGTVQRDDEPTGIRFREQTRVQSGGTSLTRRDFDQEKDISEEANNGGWWGTTWCPILCAILCGVTGIVLLMKKH